MPTKQIALVAAMVAALLGSSGCVSRLATIEHHQTIERKEVSNENLRLQHHAKCMEEARRKGVPIGALDGCQKFGTAQYEDGPRSRSGNPFNGRFRPYYER